MLRIEVDLSIHHSIRDRDKVGALAVHLSQRTLGACVMPPRVTAHKLVRPVLRLL